eukprot:1329700-Amorphochlora_amoeboformis.AAC.1
MMIRTNDRGRGLEIRLELNPISLRGFPSGMCSSVGKPSNFERRIPTLRRSFKWQKQQLPIAQLPQS